ncbi:MAG: MgtC/SapB family protein [Proteobacteria bacterium]|nr:MgtC/SapB family protein [Pseudomonadota bacterium]
MESTVTTTDILLRLAAAVVAGAIIGFDRGTRGRIAGLRTMILVCVAAAGAMIEANLILSVTGRNGSSFSMMDTLRFPLGILSGIGFIGAGAILKRGDLVMGVTTAATLWIVTVIGLIFGAGYFLLGGATVVITFVVLALVVKLEPLMERQHHAELTVEVGEEGLATDRLCSIVSEAGYTVTTLALTRADKRRVHCRLTWRSRRAPNDVPAVIDQLQRQPGVSSIDWRPVEAGQHAD